MKNWHVFSVSFLRLPAFYTMLVGPAFLAALIHFFSFNIFESREQENFYSWVDIVNGQQDTIINYLMLLKISSIIIASFFITYRWVNFRNDGNYGFWLTQGISRKRFYIQSILIFSTVIFSGQFTGLIFYFYFGAAQISFGSFLKIVIILLLSDFIIIQFGMIFAEFIKDPEILIIALLGFLLSIQFFQEQLPDVLLWLTYGEQFYHIPKGWLVIFLNLISASILFVSGLYIHLRADIEL